MLLHPGLCCSALSALKHLSIARLPFAARSLSENWKGPRSWLGRGRCKAARRRRCRCTSSRSANEADAPSKPEPEGRMGLDDDRCVARRRRCAWTSPPPRAVRSPCKPHARDPFEFSDRLPGHGAVSLYQAGLNNCAAPMGSEMHSMIRCRRRAGLSPRARACGPRETTTRAGQTWGIGRFASLY